MAKLHTLQMLMIVATVVCMGFLPAMSDRLLALSDIDNGLFDLYSPF